MQQVNRRVALQRHLQREACDAGISTRSPYSRLRLDTHRAFASKDGAVLQNIAASLNLIPWK